MLEARGIKAENTRHGFGLVSIVSHGRSCVVSSCTVPLPTHARMLTSLRDGGSLHLGHVIQGCTIARDPVGSCMEKLSWKESETGHGLRDARGRIVTVRPTREREAKKGQDLADPLAMCIFEQGASCSVVYRQNQRPPRSRRATSHDERIRAPRLSACNFAKKRRCSCWQRLDQGTHADPQHDDQSTRHSSTLFSTTTPPTPPSSARSLYRNIHHPWLESSPPLAICIIAAISSGFF